MELAWVVPEHHRDILDWQSDAAELELKARVMPVDPDFDIRLAEVIRERLAQYPPITRETYFPQFPTTEAHDR